MKYLPDHVVSHRGKKHSGCIVLPAECVPRVGDVLDIRIAGNPMPIQIDSVNLRKNEDKTAVRSSDRQKQHEHRTITSWCIIASHRNPTFILTHDIGANPQP
jgi:hypothetical protein